MALNVGYYQMDTGAGVAAQEPPITGSGNAPVNIAIPDAASLAGIDVLFVNNGDNGSYGAEYLANLADIQAAVAAGMVLVIHDRYVTDAASILPGGGGITAVRDFGDDSSIEVLNDAHPITSGAGGMINDTSLDGGSASSHGYVTLASLPAGAEAILSRTDPAEIVTFGYPFGLGHVYFSTIPLDFYLNGGGTISAAMIAYATNLLDYLETLDINDAPTDIALSAMVVIDNHDQGVLIANITGTDPDGDALVYTILNDPDGVFQIVGDRLEIGPGGAPGSATSLGYIYESSVSLDIRATDPSGAYFDKTFVIDVRPPSGIDGRGYFNRALEDTRDLFDWKTYAIYHDGADTSAPVAETLLIADDGSWVRTLNDTSNMHDHATYTTYFDASGEMREQAGTYDDGRSWRTIVDTADQFDFARYTTLFDAAGQAYDQTGVYDDGRSWRTVTDTADAYGFTSYSDDYNAAGERVRQQGVDDDGSTWTYLYDVAGTEPWSVYERSWDANGVLVVDRTTPDPMIM